MCKVVVTMKTQYKNTPRSSDRWFLKRREGRGGGLPSCIGLPPIDNTNSFPLRQVEACDGKLVTQIRLSLQSNIIKRSHRP